MKLNKLTYLILVCALVIGYSSESSAQDVPPKDWFHLDMKKDNYMGVSSDRAHKEFLQGRKSKTVIVAIIDSGVDYDHEDLKDVMWVNEGEIAGNGIDDDKNGYVDDIHGWNFIGGKNGNIDADNLELTRLYRKYHKMYGGKSNAGLSKKEKKAYNKYLSYKEKYEKNRETNKENLATYVERKEITMKAISKVKDALGKKKFTLKNLEALDAGDDTDLAMGIGICKNAIASDGTLTVKKIKKEVGMQFQGAIDHFSGQVEHYYNADFDPRNIVGDDYSNPKEKIYGNNTYDGPDASHGTHVAGIVAATRNNSIGMNGIANDVKIMTIRAVPDGDERDKDVANAIRYAVDNGASIINMSFGKGFSWDKGIVDKAVKYATKKDVLLVHAAGNSNQNNDITNNFPNDKYAKRGFLGPKVSKNWVEVGALNFEQGEDYPAVFSNYGKNNVDLFAPGVKIYSTIPGDEYASFQGTSMASPVVAGVAALVRSYYPKLKASQVKEILMTSSVKLSETVNVPGEDSKESFNTLSVSGGVVNAYAALVMANQMSK